MSIVGFVLSFVFCPAGLILSIIALRQINRTQERGKELAIAGIGISAIAIVIVIIIIILAITVIIGLVVLLIIYWDEISAAFVRVGAVVWDAMKTAGKAIMRFLLAPINLVLDGIIWLVELAARLTGSDMLANAAASMREFQTSMNAPFQSGQSETGPNAPGVVTNREAAAQGNRNNSEMRVVIDNQSGGQVRQGGQVIRNGTSQTFSSPVWG